MNLRKEIENKSRLLNLKGSISEEYYIEKTRDNPVN